MRKSEFEDFCVKHAKWAREEMIANKGSFHQQAVMIDLRGRLHVIVVADGVMHDFKMRNTLTVMALAEGGADAFLVMADARYKAVPSEEEAKRIRENAARGTYSIAEDETNREAIIVAGRSHEHLIFIRQPYRRDILPDKSCIITFDDPEPKIDPATTNVETDMLPNLWERIH